LFTGEHNREQRRSEGAKETYVSWGRIDQLSRTIIHVLGGEVGRSDHAFTENLAALDRMFSTSRALRQIRNQIAHRAPSDNGGRLHLYRDAGTPITVRAIWGWTEIAASYWTHLTAVDAAISLATGIDSPTSRASLQVLPLQWPAAGVSIHGIRVLEESGIPITPQQILGARKEWAILTKRWRKKSM